MKKPENFHDFCNSLTMPYSSAKQYFDQVVLEIDVYNDSQFFYQWYSKLSDESKDTTYNNLQRLYDVTKDVTDVSFSQLRSKVSTINSNSNIQEVTQALEKILELFNNFSEESIKRSKLSVLNLLLNQADSYRRIMGAVDINECNKRCSEYNKRYDEIVKCKKTILVILLLTSIIVSSVIMLMLLYCFALAGSDSFIKFIDEHLIGLFLSFLVSLAGSIIYMYLKIIKDS